MSQPFLHELVTCVAAPTCVLSAPDGQIRPAGAQGMFHRDIRHLSSLVVAVDGREPVPVAHRVLDGGRAWFVGALMGIGDTIADPTVRVERTRRATARGLVDEIAIVNDSRVVIEPVVTVGATVDMASVQAVKHGAPTSRAAPDEGSVRWTAGTLGTELGLHATSGEPSTTVDGASLVVRWTPLIPSRHRARLSITVDATGTPSAGFTPGARPDWATHLGVQSDHPAVAPLVRRSVDDLASLVLFDESGDGDRFAAAGAPWFLTLFGRDALWAARFALPVDVGLAAGTLRTLARRQARTVDVEQAAEPGKILHEIRSVPSRIDRHTLPPLYYGSIDATPLWISVVHDAWCWGLAAADVEALLDPLVVALEWLVGHDGFLAYRDESGHGLANQGWKDSGDSIQHGDGAIAAPPITLCEVQGYAYRAALDAARLLDAFDRPGAAAARRFAADLRTRFRETFWIGGSHGRYPAVALDGAGRPVDSLTSNMGHLLSTGILDDDEAALVAGHLGGPALDSGYGVRTLADDHPMFNPLGYHSGSVWPHDTAIAIDGLAATGHGAVAAHLAGGLLAAAGHFDHRLPELFGGWPASEGPPLDYPAACRPQAWSAAASIVILRAALGLTVDVPAGRIVVRPDAAFGAWFPLTVRGLRVGSHRLDIEVDRHGGVSVDTDAPVAVTT